MSKIHLEERSVECDPSTVHASESTKSNFDLISRQPRPEPNGPITRLPVEISTMIFRLFLASFEASDIQSALFLGLICSSWRNIIWGTPSLWNQVYINVTDGNLFEGTQLMRACLDRSGNMPLTIGLTVSLERDFLLNPELWGLICRSIHQTRRHSQGSIGTLGEHCSRNAWHLVEKILRKRYQQILKKIWMVDSTTDDRLSRDNADPDPIAYADLPDAPYYLGSDTIEDKGRYPRPISLMLTSVLLRSIKASWAALTNVAVSDIDISDIFTLLLEAPLLECFVASESRMDPVTPTESEGNATIIHGNITTLVVNAYDADYAEMILGRLNLPHLTNLFISWGHRMLDHELFFAFYQGSCCQLTSLSLRGILDVSLVAMLSIAPTLSHLTLMPSNDEDDEDEGPEYYSMVLALFNKLSEIYKAPGLPVNAHSDRLVASKGQFLPALQCFTYLPLTPLDCPKIILPKPTPLLCDLTRRSPQKSAITSAQ